MSEKHKAFDTFGDRVFATRSIPALHARVFLYGQLLMDAVIEKVKNIPWIDIRTKISSEYNGQAKVSV